MKLRRLHSGLRCAVGDCKMRAEENRAGNSFSFLLADAQLVSCIRAKAFLWLCFMRCCRSYSGSSHRIIPAWTPCLKGKDSDMTPWTYLQAATSAVFESTGFGQRAAGKITRGLLGRSFTSRKWTAEFVLVLALFEKVLQQLFDLLHFSKQWP